MGPGTATALDIRPATLGIELAGLRGFVAMVVLRLGAPDTVADYCSGLPAYHKPSIAHVLLSDYGIKTNVMMTNTNVMV